jgi:hypothetical protein
MQFTKQDLQQAQNLLKMLSKAQYTLEGVEVMAASYAMQWYSKFLKQMEDQINNPPPPPAPIPPLVIDIPAPKQAIIEEKKKPIAKKR